MSFSLETFERIGLYLVRMAEAEAQQVEVSAKQKVVRWEFIAEQRPGDSLYDSSISCFKCGSDLMNASMNG